jgi:predicted TIM-barrel fold metal-dependent hydrolase
MFGTNYPMLTPAACLEGLDDLGLSDEATELFLHGNARKVFKLDATA